MYPQHENVIINISHLGSIVAVSVSDKNIGIDIEKVVPMKNDIRCYNYFFFTHTEISTVDPAGRKSGKQQIGMKLILTLVQQIHQHKAKSTY